MSVLAAVYENGVRITGCDARCYGEQNRVGAKHCTCKICKGVNHGAGHDVAIDTIHQMRPELEKEFGGGGAHSALLR